MDSIITILLVIATALCSFLGYKAGINKKENETLKNNEKLKKKYNKIPSIRSVSDLSDKLRNGKF